MDGFKEFFKGFYAFVSGQPIIGPAKESTTLNEYVNDTVQEIVRARYAHPENMSSIDRDIYSDPQVVWDNLTTASRAFTHTAGKGFETIVTVKEEGALLQTCDALREEFGFPKARMVIIRSNEKLEYTPHGFR